MHFSCLCHQQWRPISFSLSVKYSVKFTAVCILDIDREVNLKNHSRIELAAKLVCGCIDYLSIAEPGAGFLFLALATLILCFFIPAAGLNRPFSLRFRVGVLPKTFRFSVWLLRVLNRRTCICMRSRVYNTP